MIKKIFFTSAFAIGLVQLYLASPYLPSSQADDGKTKISGHIETTITSDFSDKVTDIPLRSFDKSNTILLNAATLHIKSGSGIFSFYAKAGFGSDMMVIGLLGNGNKIGVDLYQAVVNVKISENLSFTAGRFPTFEGIEVIEGPANPTITRGYLFGLAEPFTHIGGYFEFTSGKIFAKAGVVKGWDVFFDNNSGKTGVAELGFLDIADVLSFDIAYYVGPEIAERNDIIQHSVDLTGILKVSPADLWFQGNIGTVQDSIWYGAALEPMIKITEIIYLGLRYEFFADLEGKRTAIDDLFAQNISITPTLKKDGFMLRGEFRTDIVNKKIFSDGKKNVLPTVSTGISYEF